MLKPVNGMSMCQCQWCAKVDLSHVDFYVPLPKHFSQYIGVQLGSDFYKFNGLPFGLNTSPEICCSFLRVPLRLWSQQGLMVTVFVYIPLSTKEICNPFKLVKIFFLEKLGPLVTWSLACLCTFSLP